MYRSVLLFFMIASSIQGLSQVNPNVHDSTVVIHKEVKVVKKVYVVANEPLPEIRKSLGVRVGWHDQVNVRTSIQYHDFQSSNPNVTSNANIIDDDKSNATATWLHILGDYQKNSLNYEIGFGLSSYSLDLQYNREDLEVDTATFVNIDTTDTYFTFVNGDTVEIAITESNEETTIDSSFSSEQAETALTMTYLEIPLRIGFVIPLGSYFEVVPQTGLVIGVLLRKNGFIFDQNGRTIPLSSQRLSRLVFSFDTHIDLVFLVNDYWSVTAAPYYRFDITAVNAELKNQRLRSGGLGFQLGVKKYF